MIKIWLRGDSTPRPTLLQGEPSNRHHSGNAKFGPHPKLTESQTLGVRPSARYLNKPSGDADAS